MRHGIGQLKCGGMSNVWFGIRELLTGTEEYFDNINVKV